MVTFGLAFDGDAETFAALAAGRHGWRLIGRFARGRCLCCGSSTAGWAAEGDRGGVTAGCWACGDVPAVRQALGLSARRGWSPRPTSLMPKPGGAAPDMVAEADALDAVYRVMLRHLEMGADERRSKLGSHRGFGAALRERMGPLLGALPTGSAWGPLRKTIVSELRAVATDDFLRRVPELAAKDGGTYAVLPFRSEAKYFEPWCDEQGRIVALRAYFGRSPGVEPYRTTKGRWGPLVHVAIGCPRDRMTSVPWLFTEGWMKGEVAAHTLGCVAVAFSGVSMKSAWQRGTEIQQRLAPDAPTYLAFDAETWTTRVDLAVSVLELAAQVRDALGREPGYAVWTAEEQGGKVTPKGIDDAIVAGEPVQLVDRHTFGSLLGPVVEEWERADAA